MSQAFSPAYKSPSTPKRWGSSIPGSPASVHSKQFMRSTFSHTPRSDWGGSMHSYDPLTGQQQMSAVSVVSYMSDLDDDNKYLRRQLWNNRSSLNTPFQPAWSKLNREDLLNMNLENHPYWVAKSPGTFDHTRERWNLYHAPVSARKRPSTGWDSRFGTAHVLDGNPVHNGIRVLSPARRRHNGGVGAEGLL